MRSMMVNLRKTFAILDVIFQLIFSSILAFSVDYKGLNATGYSSMMLYSEDYSLKPTIFPFLKISQSCPFSEIQSHLCQSILMYILEMLTCV